MAKKKADYVAQGYADAMAGKPRAAICAATWQAGAYDSGYNDGVREAQNLIATPPAAAPTPLVAVFRKVAMIGASRAQKDANRVAEATLARLATAQRLKGFTKAERAYSTPRGRDTGYASPNIKRGAAWR